MHDQPAQTSESLAALEPEVVDAEQPRRGRAAGHPGAIPWRGWRDILWRLSREVREDRLTVVAGGVTYFTLLAIFPALAAFVSIYGLMADATTVGQQLGQLATILPAEVIALLGEQMLRLATGRTTDLSLALVSGVLLSLWSASAGVRSFVEALNVAYDETERRPFWLRTLAIYGVTLALMVLVGVASAVLIAAPTAIRGLGLGEAAAAAASLILAFLLASALFAAAYRYGPSRRVARWRWVRPGALAAAGVWLAGSAGFSWYLANVAHLDATFGSLGAVIGFMLWVWFSVLIVLLGAELNAEIERQTARDSTVGAPRPLGERGAVVADDVGVGFGGVRALTAKARETLAKLRRTRPPGPPAGPPGPPR